MCKKNGRKIFWPKIRVVGRFISFLESACARDWKLKTHFGAVQTIIFPLELVPALKLMV